MGETGLAKYGTLIVAAMILTTFLAMLLVMSFHSVPTENKELLDTLLGFLGGSFTAVGTYYLGSTAASKAKDTTIAAMSATAAQPPSPAVAPTTKVTT